MDIKELRLRVGMSQAEFANKLNIPIGTIRNWEQDRVAPPNYLLNLIDNEMEKNFMINTKTIRFISELNELAELAENGIEPIKKATQDTYQHMVFYDPNNNNRVVADACIIDDADCYHHDIISYYDELENGYSNYSITVNDESDDSFIEVNFDDGTYIIIDRYGRWYCC